MKHHRSVAFVLALTLVFTMLSGTVFADNAEFNSGNTYDNNLYSIINNYHTQNMVLSDNTPVQSYTQTTGAANLNAEKAALLNTTISDLRNAGYEAYAVNEQNYLEVGNTLDTDFSDLDLDEGHSYIAVIHGESPSSTMSSVSPASSTSAQFTYTYNGTTYTMRYLTLTAADTGASRTTTVDMLEPSWASPLNNLLNSSISAAISLASSTFGFIYSLAGIDMTEAISQTESSLILHAGVNWTRTYTQIYDSSESSWLYGSMVEYATASSYFSGMTYYEDTNEMVPVTSDTVSKMLFTEHYSDFDWRKEGAVLGIYYGADLHRERTGNVNFIGKRANNTTFTICTVYETV